jgi:hypothetical protein
MRIRLGSTFVGVGIRGAALVVLVALAAGVLGGCGGGDDLSKAEATAKINALCRESAAREEKLTLDPESQSGEEFVAAYQAQLREFERLQSDLDELQLGGESQPAADYVAAHAKAVKATQEAVDQILKPDNSATPVQKALEEQSKASDASIEVAEKAGLDDCGPHTREVEAATSPVGRGSQPQVGPGGDTVIPGSAFVGTWEGIATQIGPGEHQTLTYPVYLRIDPRPKADGGNGGVRYDSFDCLGRARIFEAGDGPEGVGFSYKLREKILLGRDNCPSGGTITAVTEGDELDWRWKQGNVEATAVLRLRDAPSREKVSEEVIRELQGHNYLGDATQWGPRGQKQSYPVRFGLWPPGKVHGSDGFTQYGDCIGDLTLISVEGDRATLREHITEGDCFDNGLMETRKVGDDQILYRWYRQSDDDRDEQNDVIAIGTLTQSMSGPALGPAPG